MNINDAKEKWCPMVRVGFIKEGRKPVVINRTNNPRDIHSLSLCIADHCMMWRWLDERDEITKQQNGYCGLAGRIGL